MHTHTHTSRQEALVGDFDTLAHSAMPLIFLPGHKPFVLVPLLSELPERERLFTKNLSECPEYLHSKSTNGVSFLKTSPSLSDHPLHPHLPAGLMLPTDSANMVQMFKPISALEPILNFNLERILL